MNRRFLQLMAISIVLFMATLLPFYQQEISTRLFNLTVSQFSRHMQNTALLMTSQVRSDLLVNDLRSVRVKLGLFQRQGIIEGYSVIQGESTIDEFTPIVAVESLKFRQEIKFSDDGAKWGEIEYFFSTSILDEGFAKIKTEIRYGLYVFTALLMIVIVVSFSVVYYSALQISPFLDRYISTMRINDVGGVVSYVWRPLINTLEESTAKYEALREESERNRRSAIIGQITSQLTHDMRAPLGIFERLVSMPDEKMGPMKPLIKDSLNRLHSMVDSFRFAEEETWIKRSIGQLNFFFGAETLKGTAEKNGISLSVKNENIPFVNVDQGKIERSWVNLVSNALGFARTSVQFEAEVKGTDLFLRVIDDGPGVPADFLPKLFQRGATHGKHDGTGLGLAYVRQIMRGHGGDVTYRRENGFTIFECRLPNAVVPEEEKILENTASFEIQLVQKMVRPVAICLEPESLCRSILEKLTSQKSEDFLFTEEREEAVIVVGNSDEIMFDVHERDEQEYFSVAPMKGDEAAIMMFLTKKFNLAAKGVDSV